MLADVLTKGSINRRALLEAFRDGKWHINGTNENKPQSYWTPKLSKHGVKTLIATFEGHTSKSMLQLNTFNCTALFSEVAATSGPFFFEKELAR